MNIMSIRYNSIISNSGGIFALFQEGGKMVPVDQFDLVKRIKATPPGAERSELQAGLDELRMAKDF